MNTRLYNKLVYYLGRIQNGGARGLRNYRRWLGRLSDVDREAVGSFLDRCVALVKEEERAA